MTHTKTSYYLNGSETQLACSITLKRMGKERLKSIEPRHKKKIIEWIDMTEAMFQDFKAELLEATK